jgi:excisionase family DNA binding protein
MTVAEHSLLTPMEAAEALRVSRSQIYRLIGEGRLPSTRIAGSVRVPRLALQALIEQATCWPEAPTGRRG